jgi:hypothetical protein
LEVRFSGSGFRGSGFKGSGFWVQNPEVWIFALRAASPRAGFRVFGFRRSGFGRDIKRSSAVPIDVGPSSVYYFIVLTTFKVCGWVESRTLEPRTQNL